MILMKVEDKIELWKERKKERKKFKSNQFVEEFSRGITRQRESH